jgi:hypothetical protein
LEAPATVGANRFVTLTFARCEETRDDVSGAIGVSSGRDKIGYVCDVGAGGDEGGLFALTTSNLAQANRRGESIAQALAASGVL